MSALGHGKAELGGGGGGVVVGAAPNARGPHRGKAPRFFWGYAVLAAAVALDACTSPGHSTGMNVLVDRLIGDVGVSRTTVSALWSTALLASSALAPAGGVALDRFGPRALGFASTAALAAALWTLSVAQSVAVVGAAASLMRFAGPECMSLVGNTTVNRWFVRRRGWATVIRSLNQLPMLAFPALVETSIDRFGWRAVYRCLALGVIVAGGAASAALESDPESCGLEPDSDDATASGAAKSAKGEAGGGGGGSSSSAAPPSVHNEPDWDFWDVMAEPYFWLLSLTGCTINLFWAGLNLHREDVFALNGIARHEVAALTVPFGVAATCGSVYTGLSIDALPVARRMKLLLNCYASIVVAMFFVSLSPTSAFAVTTQNRALLWFCAYGWVVGVWFLVGTMITADLFGRRSLGRVNGINLALGTATAGLGPLVFGWCRDATGGYRAVTTAVLVAAALLTAALALRALPQQRPQSGKQASD